jgi:hypothetical protein
MSAGQFDTRCRQCGCGPAADVTFRGHRGMILLMQFLSAPGPFCRDCGIATFRTMTSRTLVQGWWGFLSFFITPFILLINLIRVRKVSRLAPPMPHPDGQSVRPMPVGRPVYLRPTMLGLLVPLAFIGLVAVGAANSGPESLVGQCIVSVTGSTENVEFVSCDKPNEGKVISVADNQYACPDEATGWVKRVSVSKTGRESTMDGGKVLCIK